MNDPVSRTAGNDRAQGFADFASHQRRSPDWTRRTTLGTIPGGSRWLLALPQVHYDQDKAPWTVPAWAGAVFLNARRGCDAGTVLSAHLRPIARPPQSILRFLMLMRTSNPLYSLQQPPPRLFAEKFSQRVQAAHKKAAPVCAARRCRGARRRWLLDHPRSLHSQSVTARLGSTLKRSAARICALSMSTLADTTTVSWLCRRSRRTLVPFSEPHLCSRARFAWSGGLSKRTSRFIGGSGGDRDDAFNSIDAFNFN